MNHLNMKNLLGMLLLVVPLLSLAGGTDSRQYQLPDHGNLQLQVPADWRDQVKQPPNKYPPTITFTPKSGHTFTMLITPIWSFRPDHKLPTGAQLKPMVEQAINEASSQAVEKSISAKEIKGKQGSGYYFFATDKAPKPGEFKYMTQGMIRIGELLTTFTILSNDGGEKEVESGLNMIRSAEHVK